MSRSDILAYAGAACMLASIVVTLVVRWHGRHLVTWALVETYPWPVGAAVGLATLGAVLMLAASERR
jgi:NADH:ubiquinone oxidoreductase subunit 6 (subunit J)